MCAFPRQTSSPSACSDRSVHSPAPLWLKRRLYAHLLQAEALLLRIGVDPSAAVRLGPADSGAAAGPAAAARWPTQPLRALSLVRGALDVASASPGRYLFEAREGERSNTEAR